MEDIQYIAGLATKPLCTVQAPGKSSKTEDKNTANWREMPAKQGCRGT
jgi:hypothetical protein